MLRQECTTDAGKTLQFIYDADGIAGFIRGNMLYRYIRDVQGNVKHIVSSSDGDIADACEVACYTYDAWGNCTVYSNIAAGNESADIAEINPIRWKTRYYDSESGFYNIGGRYYSPETMRYINAGLPEMLPLAAAKITLATRFTIAVMTGAAIGLMTGLMSGALTAATTGGDVLTTMMEQGAKSALAGAMTAIAKEIRDRS